MSEIGIASGANLYSAAAGDDVRERPDLSGVKQRRHSGGATECVTDWYWRRRAIIFFLNVTFLEYFAF